MFHGDLSALMRKYFLLSFFALGFFIAPFLHAPAAYAAVDCNIDYCVSGTISSDTTWATTTAEYVVQGNLTINSGVTLTINPNVIVKFDAGLHFTVNGTLVATSTAGNEIFFTSIKDDSVGGDTNGDVTATSPAAGNWDGINFNSGSTGTLDRVRVRFGGYTGFGSTAYTNIYNNGGVVSLDNSHVATTSFYGIRSTAGTTTVTNSEIFGHSRGVYIESGGVVDISDSEFHDNSYGVESEGSKTLTLTDNSFSSSGGAVNLILSNGATLTHSGNTASGNGTRGFLVTGNIATSQTWTADADMPYVVSDIVVPSGKTLTVNSGTIMKFNSTASDIIVNSGGTLDVNGALNDLVYFTSIKDDDVGGDTNADASATSPATYDWNGIKINSGGSGSIDYAMLRFGGNTSGFLGMLYNTGGILTIASSTVATSSYTGLLHTSGTTTLSASIFQNNGVSIKVEGGTTTIKSSNLRNSSYGVEVVGGSVSIASSTIGDNSGYGIAAVGGNVTTRLSSFYGNARGFSVSGGNFKSLLDNIYENSSYGVYTHTTTSSTTIDVAHIHDNGGAGVHISGGGASTYIFASEINNNGGDGIYVADEDGDIKIQSNWFHDNTGDGVFSNEPLGAGLVTAEYNYWNAAGGPNDTGGDGADILYIDYNPYITALHSVSTQDSVDASKNLFWAWTGITGSNRESDWHFALAAWTELDLGSNVNIATSTGTTYLQVSTTTGSDLGWVGLYNSFLDPDTIQFNEYYIGSTDYDANDGAKRKNAMIHELGHALNLNHSSSTLNVLYPIVQPVTEVGPQDESDYYYLWQ